METRLLTVKINGRDYQVPEGISILKAARDYAGINVPTLCYLEGISEEGACALCVVEVKGARNLQRACVVKVAEGMEVLTSTPRVRDARKLNMELLLANHPKDCFTCDKSEICELRGLAADLGVREVEFTRTRKEWLPFDETSLSLVRDPNKCVLCRRCISVCAKIQSVNAIDVVGRSSDSAVSTFFNAGLGNVECVNCGQCLQVCPTGAITERDEIPMVWKALGDADKVVVVQTAPAVRVAIGEEFGMPGGTQATGKMAAALRRMGFAKVFDTDFTADLTIMEEGYELIGRLKNGGTLPLITSCSPGWVKFAETFFPKVLDHVSSCKSPQQMFGTVTKTYWAEKMGIDPRKVVVVSIMPCTAKKFEKERPEMKSAFHYWKDKMGLRDDEVFNDVDYVLTTREAAQMIREAGLDFVHLPDEDFDKPLGESTGAAVIFGATGGVMEAALRTAYEVVTGKTLAKLDFMDVRGLEGIKATDVDLDGTTLKVAVANGLGNARVLMEQIERGESPYHFIEIMCCPGGCLGGGGQPISHDPDIKKKRASAIYREDAGKPIRKSHENSEVQQIYKEFFGEPNSEKAHHLLHTEYCDRSCK
ncbi:MAG: NADH-dependent [FeFe] hydrogenase, group A6 [Caldisericota bacterium]|jgi:iron-only hydrogenase group A|nr:NADH-dependent [FeFe] hydrogenase, group A6 [Caldisericota bacterium]